MILKINLRGIFKTKSIGRIEKFFHDFIPIVTVLLSISLLVIL